MIELKYRLIQRMNIWVVVFVFLIIAIIIILLLWAFWPQVTRRSSNVTNNQTRNIKVGFLSSCGGNAICNNNLTCVSGVCLKDQGQECNNSTDCVPPSNCLGSNILGIGVCSNAKPGTLNGPCPCTNATNIGNNLICDSSLGAGSGVCKINTGSSGCSNNNDCLSNAYCSVGVCQPLKSIGEECLNGQCQNNLICGSGDCSKGKSYCQQIHIGTCNVGAFCTIDDKPGCNNGLMCDTSSNTCQPGSVGFMGFCNDDTNFCISGLFCSNDGVCIFQQPPNDCSGNQGCPDGQTCANGQCLVNTGDMCKIDNNCISTTCNNGLSNIYIWDADELKWNNYTNNPGPGIQFKRITATTSINNDTLWGLDFSIQPTMGGLWKLINPSNGHWIKTFDGTTRTVTTDVDNNARTTSFNTIWSIASDRKNIYALMRITSTTIDTLNGSVINDTIDWGIFKIGLNSSNQAVFIPVVNANPPQYGGNDILNITDFDVNTNGDILVVGNTVDSSISDIDENNIYSLSAGGTSFSEVPVSNPPDMYKQARFYYINNIETIDIDNCNNVAYVSGDDPGDDLLQFTGILGSLNYPTGGKNNYNIIDYSIPDSEILIPLSNINNLWLIAPDPSSQNTGYYQIANGNQFNIPGYVGGKSNILAIDNRVYSQSNGVCN